MKSRVLRTALFTPPFTQIAAAERRNKIRPDSQLHEIKIGELRSYSAWFCLASFLPFPLLHDTQKSFVIFSHYSNLAF